MSGIKVGIGSQYTRPWFEERTPVRYAWFRGPMTTAELRLQEALLTQRGTSLLTRIHKWLTS
jgi:hypothetical protein